MTGLIGFLVGYRTYSFDLDDISRISKIALEGNFDIRFLGTKIRLPLYKCKKFEALVGTRVKFTRSNPLGLGGALYMARRSYLSMVAFFLVAILWYLSSLFVWDVRVSGNEILSDEAVIEEIKAAGLQRGTLWGKIDKAEVELSVVLSSEEISWIQINRYGSVANVRVVDRYSYESEKKSGYANIVSARDGIIEEITVRSGVAVVKVGDTVKKGDLLISGILADGTFTYAKGEVVARVSDAVSVKKDRVVEEKSYYGEHLFKISLTFFNKELNIFKNYGNFGENYDIIEKTENLTLLGKELPISVKVTRIREYELEKRVLDDSELFEETKKILDERLAERLNASTLLKVKYHSSVSEGGYQLSADIVASEDIAMDLTFKVN